MAGRRKAGSVRHGIEWRPLPSRPPSVFPRHLLAPEGHGRDGHLRAAVGDLTAVDDVDQRLILLVIDAPDRERLEDEADAIGEDLLAMSPMTRAPVCRQAIDALDGSSNQLPFDRRSSTERLNRLMWQVTPSTCGSWNASTTMSLPIQSLENSPTSSADAPESVATSKNRSVAGILMYKTTFLRLACGQVQVNAVVESDDQLVTLTTRCSHRRVTTIRKLSTFIAYGARAAMGAARATT